MKKRKKLNPRVLIIGSDCFGKEHLETWERLAPEGQIEVAGAVVSSEPRRQTLECQYGIPVFLGLSCRYQKLDCVAKKIRGGDLMVPIRLSA